MRLLAFLRRFARLRLQRPKEAVTGPLGLSPEQLDSLDGLRSAPAWRHYSQALEGLYQQQLAALVRPLGHDAYLFQCGVVFALERAATIVDDLLSARDHHAQRTKRDHEPDVRAVLSSPFWDAYQRTRAKSS